MAKEMICMMLWLISMLIAFMSFSAFILFVIASRYEAALISIIITSFSTYSIYRILKT